MVSQYRPNITERDYWLKSNPSLNIENPVFFNGDQSFTIDENTAEHLYSKLKKEGYCQRHVKPSDWQLPLELMRTTVCALVECGMLPVFALVYDEFWSLLLRQRNLLNHFLGENYRMMPAGLWVWHVDPKRNEGGWDPHRDRPDVKTLRHDGTPNSLTVWIPLSKATPLNACMHILPTHKDSNYNKNHHSKNRDIVYVEQDGWRALPAEPGDVFFWNHEIFHWGGVTNPLATEPRISIATEFQRADVNALEPILMNNQFMPSFEIRLQLIAKLINKYTHMYKVDSQNIGYVDDIVNSFGSI